MNQFAAKLASDTAKRNNTVPDATRQKQIQEELSHFTKKLQESLVLKNEQEAFRIQEKLFSVHAELVALNIKRIEETYGFVSDPVLKKMISDYTLDCYQLAKHVDQTFYGD